MLHHSAPLSPPVDGRGQPPATPPQGTPSSLADLEHFATVLPSEKRVPGRLPVILSRQDFITMTVMMLLFPFTTASMTLVGASAWVYFLLAFGAFLIPSAVVTAKLSRMYPCEGALYVWVFKALGSGWDTLLGAFCTWWPPILLTVALPFSLPQLLQGLLAIWGQTWNIAPWQQVIIFLLTLLPIWGFASMPLARLRTLFTAFLYLYLGVVVCMGLAALIWVSSGHPAQTDLRLSAIQLDSHTWLFFAFAVLGCLGIQLPLNLSQEARGAHARAYTSWSVWLVIAGYLVMWAAVAVVLPQDPTNPLTASNVGNFPQVFVLALGGSLPGRLLATLANLVLCLLSPLTGSLYMVFLSRLVMVAALERRLPQWLARVDRAGVPRAALGVQFGFTLFFTLVVIVVAANAPGPDFIAVVMNLLPIAALAPWTLTSLTLFLVGGVLLARAHAARVGGPPNWLVGWCCVLGAAASLGTLLLIVLIPWTPLVDPLSWVFWLGLLVLGPLLLGAIYSFVLAAEPGEVWLRWYLARRRREAPPPAGQPDHSAPPAARGAGRRWQGSV